MAESFGDSCPICHQDDYPVTGVCYLRISTMNAGLRFNTVYLESPCCLTCCSRLKRHDRTAPVFSLLGIALAMTTEIVRRYIADDPFYIQCGFSLAIGLIVCAIIFGITYGPEKMTDPRLLQAAKRLSTREFRNNNPSITVVWRPAKGIAAYSCDDVLER